MEYKSIRNNFNQQAERKEKAAKKFQAKIGEFTGPKEVFYKLLRNYDKFNTNIEQSIKMSGDKKMAKNDYALSLLNVKTKRKRHYGIIKLITAKAKDVKIEYI